MQLIDRLADRALAPQRTPLVATGVATPIQAVVEDDRPTLPSGFLRRILDMRDSMPHTTRQALPGYIHVSSLPSICTRQWSLMVEMDMRLEENITGAHRVMWQIGRSVEQHVRGQVIDGYVNGVFGHWDCICKAQRHTGFKPRPSTRCGTCSGQLEHYAELTLTDDENGVTGNPDIVVRHEEKYLPVEIKSMTGEQWSELTTPKAAHVYQAMGYRHLLRTAGYPVHDDVVLIYCSKHFKWGTPYKEFHVNASTSLRESTMDDLFAKAREIKLHREAGTTPPRHVCQSESSPRARKCPVQALCFSRSST